MKISKAIIPVAGWGTRRLPITKAIEKCMLPIGNRPLVDYVVQDCIAAGITDIYFVVSEWMTQIQAYYSDNGMLDTYLIGNGKEEMLPLVKPPRGVSFHFVVQNTNGKYGTAIPVSLVVPKLAQGESAVVLMGDDFIFNADGTSEVRRLLEATPEGGNAMLGANVPRETVGRYGVIETNERSEFVRIVEKPQPKDAPSTLINISKYVLNYELLTAVARYSEIQLSGEYYITEPINQYIATGGNMMVVPGQGVYLDGGSEASWLHANNVVFQAQQQG
ncbi:MAG TPA: sugar phosphate nucleotidyltransferase [Candidatus Saccharimonadales bacterium]